MMIVSTPALSDNARISRELNAATYVLRRVEAEERLAEAERKLYQLRAGSDAIHRPANVPGGDPLAVSGALTHRFQ